MLVYAYIYTYRTKITIKPSFQSEPRAQLLSNSSNCIDFMESLDVITPNKEKIESPHSDNVLRSNHLFRHTGSLEIMSETVRILRCNPTTFIAISALLIYPVSAIHLSNQFVDQSIVKQITKLLLFVANSCGLSSMLFVKQSCHQFAEIAISSMVSFPLYCTLLLISKSAVVYSVDCTYSRKKLVFFKFYKITRTIWGRVISTYLLSCALIVGCLTFFMIILTCASKLLYVIGFSRNSIACIAIISVMLFLVFLTHIVIICDVCMVISMWQDISGPQALVRAIVLFRGQTLVGVMMFLGSTIGMAIVKALFEHWVKVLSYGDGCLRMWERTFLVLMYSFVVLTDFMMSTVFFFSCKSYSLEAVECGM